MRNKKMSFRDILTESKYVLRYADKSVVEKYINDIRKEIEEEPFLERIKKNKGIDSSFCVDYSNELYSFGNKYVYMWITDTGKIFYIGSGNMDRVTNTVNRTQKFKKMITEHNCKPFLLCANVDRRLALDIELMCIWYVSLQGVHLDNNKDMLTEDERLYFSCRDRGMDIPEIDSFESKYYDYDSYKTMHDEVYQNLDKIFKLCLSFVATKKPIFEIEKNEREYVMWTINGVTKRATEWCKEYNKSYGSVVHQVKRYELTLEEALKLPIIPKGKTIYAIEYWKEQGFDVKLRETPLDKVA